MSPVNIVLDAQNLPIGIHSLKSVSLAILTNPGILILTSANVAHLQDLSKPENVHAHLQKLNGMPIARPATAHQTLSVTYVSHVQPQDSGIIIKRNVFAHHPKLNGI